MIIGICGGTGSGKTTIARAIVDAVKAENVVLVEQDSYYRNLADMPLDERHQANFDHPDSIDSDMLVNHFIGDLGLANHAERTNVGDDRVAEHVA